MVHVRDDGDISYVLHQMVIGDNWVAETFGPIAGHSLNRGAQCAQSGEKVKRETGCVWCVMRENVMNSLEKGRF
jgi:hypothetical protein